MRNINVVFVGTPLHDLENESKRIFGVKDLVGFVNIK